MEMASTDTSMSKVEMRHLWISSASGPASCLHRQDTHEDIAGYLATLPYQYILSVLDGRERCRKHHRGSRTRP
jgi:hypothetical protein